MPSNNNKIIISFTYAKIVQIFGCLTCLDKLNSKTYQHSIIILFEIYYILVVQYNICFINWQLKFCCGGTIRYFLHIVSTLKSFYMILSLYMYTIKNIYVNVYLLLLKNTRLVIFKNMFGKVARIEIYKCKKTNTTKVYENNIK